MRENDFSPRGALVAFVLAVLMIGGGALLLLASRPEPPSITLIPPVPTATPAPSATPGPLEVYVIGAVAEPQTSHLLPIGSRVQDAIDAAGGLLDEADRDAFNPAERLYDGALIAIPTRGAEQATLPTPVGGQRVRLNTASLEQLMSLPGIGQATAERILAYREQLGRFTSLEELDAVEGIGTATLERLRPLVSLD